MDPKRLAIKDFTYELPEERIAKYPLPERDSSKLLIYKEGQVSEGQPQKQNTVDHETYCAAGNHR